MSVPAAAILGGLIILTSFIISPATVKVPNTPWDEPTLVWLTISMPTGSRKTTIFAYAAKENSTKSSMQRLVFSFTRMYVNLHFNICDPL